MYIHSFVCNALVVSICLENISQRLALSVYVKWFSPHALASKEQTFHREGMEVEMPQKLGVGGVSKRKINSNRSNVRRVNSMQPVFFVSVLVYVRGLCDGKFWNISPLSSLVDNMS